MKLIADNLRSKCLINAAMLSICSICASGQVLHGTVTNGTTGKPAAGDPVVLIKLEKGMEEEVRTTTSSTGTFSLRAGSLNAPHLIRVRHQNVNYLEPLKPGSNNTSITVYDSAPKVTEIDLLDQSQIYEASGSALRVIELLRWHNFSSPGVTQPDFQISLPEGAQIQNGQAIPPSGMPIPSAPVPQGNNKYMVPYPLRPGVTQYELVYMLPYQGSYKATPSIELPAQKFFVITPKSMKFAADSTIFHTDQWTIEPNLDVETHAVDNPAPGKDYPFEVAGMGQVPQTGEASSGRDEDNRPGGGLGVPNTRPNPLSSGQWAFLGVLTLFLAGGAVIVFMTTRPAAQPAAPARGQPAPLMDALKEEMFQLEAERLQGKINGHDYDAAKAALVKTLQRAMKRKGST